MFLAHVVRNINCNYLTIVQLTNLVDRRMSYHNSAGLIEV